MATKEPKPSSGRQPLWLVYFSLLLGGLLLLSDAYHFLHLYRWTVKLGIGLIYSALSLFIGRGRAAGYVAAVIIWVVVIVTLFM